MLFTSQFHTYFQFHLPYLYVPIHYPINFAVRETSFNASEHFPRNNLLSLVESSHPSKTSLNMIL